MEEEQDIETAVEPEFEEAQTKAIEHAYTMRKYLDKQELRKAVESAVDMLSILRHTEITIAHYSEICKLCHKLAIDQHVTINLKFLETQFLEESRKGRKMSDLYTAVQQTPKVLPRLYLLILAGCCCIDSNEFSLEEIIQDFIEMAKGVQHPLKALMLRNYLTGQLKGRLLDKSKFATEPTVNFFIQNLASMTKFWMRLQRMNYKVEEATTLIGFLTENVQRISSLTRDVSLYQKMVLPLLLDHLNQCRDKVAQQAILESVIHAFPETYHLATLPQLLDMCVIVGQNEGTGKWTVTGLLDKLANSEQTKDADVLMMFQKCMEKIMEEHAKSGNVKRLLELSFAFIKSLLKAFPEKVKALDAILESTILNIFKPREEQQLPFDSQRNLERVLIAVIDSLSTEVLGARNFAGILVYLPIYLRRNISKQIINVPFIRDNKLYSQ
eukprot:TRINITY_DN2615_c0_g1_i1.p1 TRINITY_DN2615_c0_g1~~TRINITY_DN2615_c0_g1_i1.p1  ORF type:complete len:441 (-),score=37.02 TRINITY_DN2615_c0_g1_i1:1089-2411(-)